MKDLVPYFIGFAIALVVFIILWRQGAFLRLSTYWREMQEEMRKCTWPTWEELTGSTAVVMFAVAVLGGFIIVIDLLVTKVLQLIV